jgi:flagellar biosynthesis chaperone FliJ
MFNLFKKKKMAPAKDSSQLSKFNRLIKVLENTTNEYNKELSNFLSSNWRSELDNNFSVKVKAYSSGTFSFHIMLFIPILASTKSLAYRGTFNKQLVLETDYLDFINVNLQNVIEQMKNDIIVAKKSVQNAAQVKSHIRIWYNDSIEALATYPKYKDSFKYYYGDDYNFEGRFVFNTPIIDVEKISEKFPDADLLEIYDPETASYKKFTA